MVMRYKSFAAYSRRLNRLQKEITSSSGRAVTKSAEWIAVRAAQIAPKDTGALVNNIVWKTSKRGGAVAEVIQFDPSRDNPNRAGKRYNYAAAMSPIVSQKIGARYNPWLADAVKRNGADPEYLEKAANEGVTKFMNEVKTAMSEAPRKSQ